MGCVSPHQDLDFVLPQLSNSLLPLSADYVMAEGVVFRFGIGDAMSKLMEMIFSVKLQFTLEHCSNSRDILFLRRKITGDSIIN